MVIGPVGPLRSVTVKVFIQGNRSKICGRTKVPENINPPSVAQIWIVKNPDGKVDKAPILSVNQPVILTTINLNHPNISH